MLSCSSTSATICGLGLGLCIINGTILFTIKDLYIYKKGNIKFNINDLYIYICTFIVPEVKSKFLLEKQIIQQ